MSMLFLVLFFESIIFPTIVALGMRGLGKYSKRGSGFIIAGVSGGAVVPPLLFVAADSRGEINHATGNAPTAFAMVVPLIFFLPPLSYALAVNFAPKYRTIADSFHTTDIGIVNGSGHAKDEESHGVKEGTALGDGGAKERTVQTEAVDEEKRL
jgi:FHS family L-fucose permease-like MFS transporter